MSKLTMVAMQLIGFVAHIWTVGIAYSESGFIAAFLTLLFPVLGEIYWLINQWNINDAYVYTVLAVPALYLISMALVVFEGE